MVTSSNCVAKYGEPTVKMEYAHMQLWDIPAAINRQLPNIPDRVYCNKDMVNPLLCALQNIVQRGLQDQVKTWDGLFNIRNKRGLKSWSLHSWGIAVDINAGWNRLGQTPQMSKELVACFTDAGFDWGGTWSRKDGMHFQLAKI